MKGAGRSRVTHRDLDHAVEMVCIGVTSVGYIQTAVHTPRLYNGVQRHHIGLIGWRQRYKHCSCDHAGGDGVHRRDIGWLQTAVQKPRLLWLRGTIQYITACNGITSA